MGAPRPWTTTAHLPSEPTKAFDSVLEDLRDSLARKGIVLEAGPGGRLVDGQREVGRVTDWEPGKTIRLEIHPADWTSEDRSIVELHFDKEQESTRLEFKVWQTEAAFSDHPEELAAWFGSSVLAPLVQAVSRERLANWIIDRRGRRPTGPQARETYANPVYHWPNFLLILDRIRLASTDNLLEVGCGGGAFMRKALESGCRATAIDHSPEMLRLTIRQNQAAVSSGELVVLEGDAEHLPVASDSFTCAVSTGVFGFIPDHTAALREIRRALRPGGRMAVFASTPELKGTPASPEPFASRIQFFEPTELERLGREAGFVEVFVEEPDLEPYARQANLPEDIVAFFHGIGGAVLMTARKA